MQARLINRTMAAMLRTSTELAQFQLKKPGGGKPLAAFLDSARLLPGTGSSINSLLTPTGEEALVHLRPASWYCCQHVHVVVPIHHHWCGAALGMWSAAVETVGSLTTVDLQKSHNQPSKAFQAHYWLLLTTAGCPFCQCSTGQLPHRRLQQVTCVGQAFQVVEPVVSIDGAMTIY